MKNLKPEFDFDDILIIPKVKTHIKSRYQGISLPKTLPLFTAPMDTVVNETNYKEFLNAGIGVTLPRTIKHNHVVDLPHGVFLSMGFDDIDFELKSSLRNIRDNEHILIDVANGHMQRVFDYCREIKRLRPDIILMVGNIANPDTYTWYAKGECVDYIKVENFNHYLRNAMSYCDAKTLDRFIGKTNAIQITTRAYDRFNK